MVQHCCVPFCKSKVGDTDNSGVKLKFHRMPHTSERFSEWVIKITDKKRLSPLLSSGSRVCSKHFHKEDYVDKPPLGNNQLKKEISPSIFHWNSKLELESTTVEETDNLTTTSFLTEELKKQIQADIMDSTDAGVESTQGTNGNTTNIVRAEVTRKNAVIQQLLTRILELEDEEKGMKRRISELRSVNVRYEQQIKDLTERNNKLESKLKAKGKDVKVPPSASNPDEAPSPKKLKLGN